MEHIKFDPNIEQLVATAPAHPTGFHASEMAERGPDNPTVPSRDFVLSTARAQLASLTGDQDRHRQNPTDKAALIRTVQNGTRDPVNLDNSPGLKNLYHAIDSQRSKSQLLPFITALSIPERYAIIDPKMKGDWLRVIDKSATLSEEDKAWLKTALDLKLIPRGHRIVPAE